MFPKAELMPRVFLPGQIPITSPQISLPSQRLYVVPGAVCRYKVFVLVSPARPSLPMYVLSASSRRGFGLGCQNRTSSGLRLNKVFPWSPPNPAPPRPEAASLTRPLELPAHPARVPTSPLPPAVAVGRAPSSLSHPSANERAPGPLGLVAPACIFSQPL